MESLCKSCLQPCLGVGTEDHNWGIPSCVWGEGEVGESATRSPGEHCNHYAPKGDVYPEPHNWFKGKTGTWYFQFEFGGGHSIECPVPREGVFPTPQEWEEACAGHKHEMECWG